MLIHRASLEQGESLIETLIAMMIVGIAVAAVLGAVAMGSALSGNHRDLTTADVGLKAVAESIMRAPYDATANPAAAYQVIASNAQPAGYTAQVQSVKCWQPGGGSVVSYDASVAATFPTCSLANNQGLELISLQVSLTRQPTQATETTQIVKRQ